MNWISVADAAYLVKRTEQTIYNWINAGRLRYRLSDDGRTIVDGKQVLEVEPTVKRGRPPGSTDRKFG